jgi:hypothetical protein
VSVGPRPIIAFFLLEFSDNVVAVIDEAKQLLQAAEAEADPQRKLAALEEALDLLDEAQDGRAKVLAGNLRRSYTRRLITQLFALKKADVLTWFDYVRFLLLRLQPEVEAVLKENPELQAPYQEFLALWAIDAVQALKPKDGFA